MRADIFGSDAFQTGFLALETLVGREVVVVSTLVAQFADADLVDVGFSGDEQTAVGGQSRLLDSAVQTSEVVLRSVAGSVGLVYIGSDISFVYT